MELSDIASPTYSINSQALKLNCSSIASSTPSCNPLGPFVHFEEFEQSQKQQSPLGRPSYPKKRLTIQIDEDYDFQQHAAQGKAQQVHLQLLIPTPQSQPPSQSQFLNFELMVKSYQQQIANLKQLYSQSQQQKKSIQVQNDQLRLSLKRKEDVILQEQQINQQFAHKLAHFEQLEAQQKFYDERMREKQGKYRQLQKVHEKVVAMNKNLQRELREQEKVIMELQKQLQKNICQNQQDNLTKIKEGNKLKQSALKLNSNKQNSTINGPKSVDKKKVSSHANPSKKAARASSSSNLGKKIGSKNTLN